MDNLADVWGDPRYHKETPIFPIRMKDSLRFYDSLNSIMISKNDTDNVEVIRMSYMKFIYILSLNNEYRILYEKFTELMRLVFREEKVELFENEKGRIIMNVNDKYQIRETEFDKIKTIISEQNLVDIEDDNLHPEVRKKIQEAREFMAKRGNNIAPLDQRIIAYRCVMKVPYSEIKELTLYQFNRELERCSHINESDALLHAKYSGMVTFKDETKLPNWLSEIKREGDGLIQDASKFKQQVANDLGR